MIRLWATIANKLGISQENALLPHGLVSGWLNVLAKRKAFIVVTDIVHRFGLDEYDFEITYGQQLLAKGILTATEAEVFAGNYHDETNGTTKGATQEAPAGTPAGDTTGT